MKKLITVMVLAAVLAVSGCVEPQLTGEQIKQLATDVEVLITKAEDYQDVASKIFGTLADSEIVDGEVVENVAKINEEIDRVRSQITEIAAAAKDIEYASDGLSNLLTALQAANRVSAAFNPYAVYVETGLGLAVVLLGLFARKKAAEAKVNGKKYAAHKAGVELTMKEMSVDGDAKEWETALYENIGRERSDLGVGA